MASSIPNLDWVPSTESCFLCGEKNGTFKRPFNNNALKNEPGILDSSYDALLTDLDIAIKADYLPSGLSEHLKNILKVIDFESERKQLVSLMKKHKAMWHGDCRRRIRKDRKDRKDRKNHKDCKEVEFKRSKRIPDQCDRDDTMDSVSPVKTRRMCDKSFNSSFNLGSEDMSFDIEEQKTEEPNLCTICDESGGRYWRRASTLGLDKRVRLAAIKIGDRNLIAKLSAGDMIAIESKYHAQCLTKLYRKAEHIDKDFSDDTSFLMKVQAFEELVDFIEEGRGIHGKVYEMSKLIKSYRKRLANLKIKCDIHTTRLRQDILAAIPDLAEIKGENGRYELVFDEDLASAVKLLKHSTASEIAICAQAAKILRSHNLKHRNTLQDIITNSQSSYPPITGMFYQMMLEGSQVSFDIYEESEDILEHKRKAVSTLSQLTVFNTTSHPNSRNKTGITRHSKVREVPQAYYHALKLYQETRKESIIDIDNSKGLCISYDRLRCFLINLANSILARWNKENLVFPIQGLKGVFLTGAGDNGDSNSRSYTCRVDFHGFVFSLVFHPTPDNPGIPVVLDNDILLDSEKGKKNVSPMPESYTEIDPTKTLDTSETLKVPHLDINHSHIPSATPPLRDCVRDIFEWLDHTREIMEKEGMSPDDEISFAAYNATKQGPVSTSITPCHMSPVFHHSSNDPCMICHAMVHLIKVTEYFNPGQKAVITFDGPLYIIAKKLQWKYPELVGEDKIFVMPGGMHIEKLWWEICGCLLEGSGWSTLLTNAEIATSGRAQSFLSGSHIYRSRYMHQVTVIALYILMLRAYEEYRNENRLYYVAAPYRIMELDEWLNKKCKDEPQVMFWNKVLQYEMLGLQFVRSIRLAKIDLYRDCVALMTDKICAHDHPTYERILTTHQRDMNTIEELHPGLYVAFKEGHFVGQKSDRRFSKIALDQMNEQLIDVLKNSGSLGTDLLTGDPATLRRQLVVDNKVTQILSQFEEPTLTNDKHHEQYPRFQLNMKEDVLSLITAFNDAGSPYIEDSGKLVDLGHDTIYSSEVIEGLNSIDKTGSQEVAHFFNTRFLATGDDQLPFMTRIHRNNIKLMSSKVKSSSSTNVKVTTVKEERDISMVIIHALQAGRVIDYPLFSRENSGNPPALATATGEMFHGTKSDLMHCLLDYVETQEERPVAPTGIIIDASFLIQTLKPGTAKTFGEYISNIIISYLRAQLLIYKRVDIVFDIYLKKSLKDGLRKIRGDGEKKRVRLTTKIPKNFQSFLRVNENKTELNHLIASNVAQMDCPNGKLIISTRGDNILSSQPIQSADMITPCDHEEADTRTLLHAAHMKQQGFESITLRANDTDILILSVFVQAHLGFTELWASFGTGKHHKFIPVHNIVTQIGQSSSLALPGFHAYTGGDNVESFHNKGKKTCWELWQKYPEFTSAFDVLSQMNPTKEDINRAFPILNKYTALLFQKTHEYDDVDSLRQHLFLHKGKSFDSMPPGSDALKLHTLRAAYQGGHIWGKTLVPMMNAPSPCEWGWIETTERFYPMWTSIDTLSRKLTPLRICGCQVKCESPCTCCVLNLTCTGLCGCKGECFGKKHKVPAPEDN